MKRILIMSMLSLLTACGGGGETEAPQPSQAASSTQAQPQPQSDKLSDNKAPDNAQFSQFKSQNMEIDISGLGFEAKTVFLKIYTPDNKTLFLGKVPNSPSFEFYLPNNVSKVKYDVFSTLKTDPQITKEYEL
ncbi:hypothetical protein C1E24_04225 [Pseudoalteromonas phenolica]|uniref:Uncharacterized protein n=1 Tax=Pseudoalteromonas phenolica TaxID=161398 RepID=A0A5R9Q694_9GAMM|nr:hypothetical protein [Pseudoalteromonas phenolica]TLX48016.1 hypothetical protein C1E24_04225 [Pseudoalteromonas phenolica]